MAKNNVPAVVVQRICEFRATFSAKHSLTNKRKAVRKLFMLITGRSPTFQELKQMSGETNENAHSPTSIVRQ